MGRQGTRRSRTATILIVLRIVLILAGIVSFGRWGTGSLGGDIQAGYLIAALVLFVAAFGLSFLD